MQITPPASRNAPCPCGSGRRFKDCHGGIAPSGGSRDGALNEILAQALAAQQAGRLDAAMRGYENALALDPGHFDALHMLGVTCYQRGEFDRALPLIDRALAVVPDSPSAAFNRALVQAALDRRPAERELEQAAAAFGRRMEAEGARGMRTGDSAPVRVIAFYLPQFHRIPENDAWWGEGFTEWTNVRRAQPNFAGHWQPHVPGELGYYDLTDPAVRAAQAQLARAHGVDAFCYYYYWFGGKRLLDRPLAEVVATGAPDLPFCICWANENWTRRWDGLDSEVLIAQRHAPEDARAFIQDVLPLLRDRRYVRVGGRPLLLVYKIADIPDVASMVAVWRTVCADAGGGNPYLCAVQRAADDDPTRAGFDAAVEFPPIGHRAESLGQRVGLTNPAFRGTVFGYANLAAHYLMLPRPRFRQFRGVTPVWDNTARRQGDPMIVTGSSPELFGVWIEHALRQTRLRHAGDERLLFVNAWNEWAEGNHLEPDARYGRRYLHALRAAREREDERPPFRPSLIAITDETMALRDAGTLTVERFGPARPESRQGRVAVVMPVYNHARFLERSLASLAAQTMLPDELIAVDDGSTDGSAEVVARFARSAPFRVLLARQPNAGADRALNRGLALTDAETIALINSDDCYLPARLARLTSALADGVDLAFSDTALVDDSDAPAEGAYARELRARIDEALRAPSLLDVFVRHNAAVSTGNLIFRRALLERTGGFAPFAVCHDWDFLLAASHFTRFAFVPERLYQYRLHDGNTFSGKRLAGRAEGEIVLDRFFSGIDSHPWLKDPSALAAFLSTIRSAGLEGYLRSGARARMMS